MNIAFIPPYSGALIMDSLGMSFSQILSAIVQSAGIFFKYSLIMLLAGIVLAGIFSCILTVYYQKRRKNDDSKVMYVFALILIWSGWCIPMLILGGLGGALAAYRTVLIKEAHKNPSLFSAPEAAEFYIVSGNLEKLAEMDSASVGKLIQKDLDEFHKKKTIPLYDLVIRTNRFADKVPLVLDKQLKLPEIANELNKYSNAMKFGSIFSSSSLRSALSASLKNKELQDLAMVWKWYFHMTKSFEAFLAERKEYHGEISLEQLCDAQRHFLLDDLLDSFLLQKFLNYLLTTLIIIAVSCCGSFALVLFWTKPEKN